MAARRAASSAPSAWRSSEYTSTPNGAPLCAQIGEQAAHRRATRTGQLPVVHHLVEPIVARDGEDVVHLHAEYVRTRTVR